LNRFQKSGFFEKGYQLTHAAPGIEKDRKIVVYQLLAFAIGDAFVSHFLDQNRDLQFARALISNAVSVSLTWSETLPRVSQ
jgi:hypothetical protein